MTVIRATCPNCGEVELTPMEVELKICSNSERFSKYYFNCPVCKVLIIKSADPNVIKLLISGGVKTSQYHVIEEAVEIDRINDPPISIDYYLDSIIELENMDDDTLTEIVDYIKDDLQRRHIL